MTAYTSLLSKFAAKIKPDAETGSLPDELKELVGQCDNMKTDMEHIMTEIEEWRTLHKNLRGPLKGIPILKPLVEKFATAVRPLFVCAMPVLIRHFAHSGSVSSHCFVQVIDSSLPLVSFFRLSRLLFI